MSVALGGRHQDLGARLILFGFGAVIAMFIAAAVVGVYETHRSQQNNRLTVENMLASIELVARLVHDVEEKQVLVDAHIFEKEQAHMARLEEQIADVDVDFAANARAYDVIATLPGEREIWTAFKAQLASLQGGVEQVLADSRENRDVLARDEMRALDERFARVDETAADLIRINQAYAVRAADDIAARQRTSLLIAASCALGGTLLSFLIAGWVVRAMNRRAAQVLSVTAELEQRNQDLDAFAGRVAHDLRGPLTTISMAAGLLAKRAPQEEGTSALLKRGVARMETLIRDLLALSQTGVVEGPLSCDPSAVARSVEEETKPRIQAEGGTMHVDVKPAAVRCGEGLLHQAFANLIDNAVEYRRKDMPVEVEVEGRVIDSMYELHVSDNGIGMGPDDAAHAFDPFFRAVTSMDRPGTGLGLSIVKRLVEANGGDVKIESHVRKGTSVTIHLPLAAAPGPAGMAG